MQTAKAFLAALVVLGLGGCAADAPESQSQTEAAIAQSKVGSCVPTTPNAEFDCRVARARDAGQHRLVTTVYESFGVNAGASAQPSEITHTKAGWVRIGIDNGDKTPLAHLPDYASRIRSFHRQGIKVLFNITEGVVTIPNAVGGGGDYAADSCSTDPSLHGMWPACVPAGVAGSPRGCCTMTPEKITALENRWGIRSKLTPNPDPKNDYLARFKEMLTSFVMDLGAGDDDARPDVWEILNEPDNNGKNATHPHGHQLNVHAMAGILKVSRGAIDAANARYHASTPKERLAFGALMMSGSWRMTKAAAILASPDPEHPVPLFDLATFHVYVPKEEAGGIEGGTRDMAAAALGRPLMITEFGFEVSDTASPGAPTDQAIRTLMETAHTLKTQKGLPLEASFVWSWADGESGTADHYGLTVRAGNECKGAAPKMKASMVVFAEVAEAIARSGAGNKKCDTL